MQSRLCGGDVDSPGLRSAIEAAKKDSVPKENIERAVAKGAGNACDQMEQINYEAYGPGGFAMIIVTLTDNRNRSAAEIRHTLSKQGIEWGHLVLLCGPCQLMMVDRLLNQILQLIYQMKTARS